MASVPLKVAILLLALACCVEAHVIGSTTDSKTQGVTGVKQSGNLAVKQLVDSDMKQMKDSHRIKHMHDRKPHSKTSGPKYPKAGIEGKMMIDCFITK